MMEIQKENSYQGLSEDIFKIKKILDILRISKGFSIFRRFLI